MVQTGIFDIIELSFLPVGHTHEDIDQFFSRIAMKMHTVDAVSEESFMNHVEESFTPAPLAIKLDNIANFKGYLDDNDWLNHIEGEIYYLIV